MPVLHAIRISLMPPGPVSWNLPSLSLLGEPSAGQQQPDEKDHHVCYFVRPSALARI
jgi:hypothetical protein